MSGFMRPKIEEPEKVVEPIRLKEKTLRLETPDQQANRNTRRPVGRDGFKIDRAGLAAPGGGGVGLNLPRL